MKIYFFYPIFPRFCHVIYYHGDKKYPWQGMIGLRELLIILVPPTPSFLTFQRSCTTQSIKQSSALSSFLISSSSVPQPSAHSVLQSFFFWQNPKKQVPIFQAQRGHTLPAASLCARVCHGLDRRPVKNFMKLLCTCLLFFAFNNNRRLLFKEWQFSTLSYN